MLQRRLAKDLNGLTVWDLRRPMQELHACESLRQYVFRAAPLRNVALRAPHFHSGQVWNLKQAVGVMGEVQLGAKLNDKEENDIVAFLNSLTRQLPRIEYPILPTSIRDQASSSNSLRRAALTGSGSVRLRKCAPPSTKTNPRQSVTPLAISSPWEGA